MKLAWICYDFDYELDKVMDKPRIVFSQPDEYMYYMVVPIVFAELEKNDDY